MSKATIKAEIDANIKQNGTGAITGNILNGVLNDIVDDYAEQGDLITLQEIIPNFYAYPTIDLSSVALVDGLINSTENRWITQYGAKGKIIPIGLVGGRFRWRGENGDIAFLTNNNTPVDSGEIPYVSGTSFIRANDGDIIDVPQGASYLYVPIAYNGVVFNITIEKVITPFVDLNNRMGISSLTDGIGNLDKSLFTIHHAVLTVLSGSIAYADDDYMVTDFIPIEKGMIALGITWPTTYTNFAIYDAGKNFIAAKIGDNYLDTEDYPDAKYFRAVLPPITETVLTLNIFVEGINRSLAILSHNPIQGSGIYEVGVGKQYTTLRSAMADAIQKKDSKVIVYPGVYDLAQEFATELANHNGSGILLTNGVHLIAMPGVYVKCMVDVTNTWAYDNFEPFRVGDDFTLENINIEAKNTRYCVHDERSGQGTFHHRYINCQMKYTNEQPDVKYVQCIGGGMGEHGYIEIIGGKYQCSSLYTYSGLPVEFTLDDMQMPITYHNGNNANCDGHIIIRDVYLADKGYFRFGCYGSSTKVTPIQVSGCRMDRDIWLMNETFAPTQTQNFEVIAFNNEITTPSN